MKKITTLMAMLVGCICSALAQTVASTATALDNLQSGYYVMVMKTADSRTDNTNGHFVYFDADDKGAHYDTEAATEHDLRNTALAQNDFKYVFKVNKLNGDSLTITAYGTNYSWPEVGEPSSYDRNHYDKKDHLDYGHFAMSSSAEIFGYKIATNESDWYYLEFTAHYVNRNGNIFNYKYFKDNTTGYVSLNDDSRAIGYWHSAGDNNKIRIQLYKVDDMPEPGEIATIIYNYNYNGVTRGTSTFADARVGRAFPDVDLSNLPDYVTAEKPAGNVTSDATIDIDLNVVLPFEVSTEGNYHYYYLENVQGEGTRLSSNNGLNYRTSAQAATVNGVRNDLWYVTGNPFDGFKFYSVGENKALQSNSVVSHPSVLNPSAHLSFSSGFSNVTNVWDLVEIENGFGICPHIGSEYATSMWQGISGFPKISMDNQKEYACKLNDSSNEVNFENYEPNNDAFAFRLIPATFTYALYNGGDGHTYNTFSAPFDVKVNGESDVKLYKGTADYEAKTLKMDEVAAVPAGAGVLLVGDNSEEVTFVVTSGVAALEGNALIGSTSDVTDLSDKLILGPSETTGEVGFYAAADGVTTLYANHAYLMRRSADSQLEGLSIRFGGEPTGINQLPAQKNDVNAPIYDLSGRRVLRTVKGQLYIQSGRKFMAR